MLESIQSRKDDDVGLDCHVQLNAHKTAYERNGNCTGSPVKKKIEIVRVHLEECGLKRY